MPERDWLFAIGPIDETEAHEFRDQLQGRLGESLEVDLIDHRVWFSGAVLGFMSDMQTWLEREYVPPSGEDAY